MNPPPKRQKLLIWLGCNVLFAFLPFIFDVIIQGSNKGLTSKEIVDNLGGLWSGWYSKKEVLIISTAIAADAFGSMLLLMQRTFWNQILMIAGLLVIAASCLLYGTVRPPPEFILSLFIFTIIAAGISKAIA